MLPSYAFLLGPVSGTSLSADETSFLAEVDLGLAGES
jgi:hypothetical protein